jgi:uncharacterized damage-inducible protein DinB
MATYNQWTNQNLYAVCAEIPDSERKKDLGAFFKSIHATLNHLLYADKAWMARFTGKPLDVTIGKELFSNYADLKKSRDEMDLDILAWSKSIQPEWLKEPFEYTSQVDDVTRVLPTWVLVSHFFNHQTHHRGQITTLIKQLGFEPGVMDIPWLPELNSGI